MLASLSAQRRKGKGGGQPAHKEAYSMAGTYASRACMLAAPKHMQGREQACYSLVKPIISLSGGWVGGWVGVPRHLLRAELGRTRACLLNAKVRTRAVLLLTHQPPRGAGS